MGCAASQQASGQPTDVPPAKPDASTPPAAARSQSVEGQPPTAKPETSKASRKGQVEALFRRIDVNGNGSLDKSELRRMVHADQEFAALLADDDGGGDALWECLFGAVDTDVNNELSLQEFRLMIAALRSQRLFKETDSDHSGTLSRRELRGKIHADAEIEALLGIEDIRNLSSVRGSATSWTGLFGAHDADGDLELTSQEWESALLGRPLPIPEGGELRRTTVHTSMADGTKEEDGTTRGKVKKLK